MHNYMTHRIILRRVIVKYALTHSHCFLPKRYYQSIELKMLYLWAPIPIHFIKKNLGYKKQYLHYERKYICDKKSLENHCDVFDRVWLEFKSSFLGIKRKVTGRRVICRWNLKWEYQIFLEKSLSLSHIVDSFICDSYLRFQWYFKGWPFTFHPYKWWFSITWWNLKTELHNGM